MEEDDINFDFEDTLPTQHAGGVRPVPVQAVGAAGHEHARALALTDQGPSTSGRHFRQVLHEHSTAELGLGSFSHIAGCLTASPDKRCAADSLHVLA